MTRLRAFWDRLRGSYWAVPSAMAAGAIALSVAMVNIDRVLPARLLERLPWVYTGGPEGARAVLSTIAASMITVAGVTFSITIVALTLASQQFGPRLLRNFLRDLGNQITLGTFIATYTYCLLVLRTVRGTDDTRFVPHLAVTTGVVLAMLSLGVLIYFIHHVAVSIQATQVIANVARDLHGSIAWLFPEEIGHEQIGAGNSPDLTQVPAFDGAHTVTSTEEGYVQMIASTRLLTLAGDHDLVLRIDAGPGAFVRRGSPLLAAVAAARELPDELALRLRTTFIIGEERTGAQDVGFFINQLVELALRALSPGINDPQTARACIDRLEAGLGQLAQRRMPSAYRHDDAGHVRLIARPVTFPIMLDLAFAEIARYGRSSVSVSCHLLDAIRNLAPDARGEADRQALLRHAAIIGDRSGDRSHNETDRSDITACWRAAVAALQVRPVPELIGRDREN